VFAITSRAYDSSRSQHGQVLRHICLGNAQLFLKFRHRAFASPDEVKQLQALGMRESFADDCLASKYLQVEFGSTSRHERGHPFYWLQV
jgi:hypothetical protein